MGYDLLDSGSGKKLERFSDVTVVRPSSNAFWHPLLGKEGWDEADIFFSRKEENKWSFKRKINSLVVDLEGITFKLKFTDFGHLGIFPEHAFLWRYLKERVNKSDKILNLFAYTGGATLVCADKGAMVCHVDASKTTVLWARENSEINNLDKAPIRWIVDDVFKFLKREKNRGNFYDGIILDPPSFGRGNKNEVFKIERDIIVLLTMVKDVLRDGGFVVFSCHTPGFTPIVLENILSEVFDKGIVTAGELLIDSTKSVVLPCGFYAIWEKK
jgi:23S rRNA (cytosine1962-C5)-methyltransferase